MAVPFDPQFDSTAGKRELPSRARGRQAGRPSAGHEPVRRGAGDLDAAGRRRRDPARPDARRRPAEEHRRVHPGVLPGRPGPRPARPGGHARQLGPAAGPGPLRQFRHYHETFYAQVEALSVTPFSVTSLERGLDGVLVSAARVLQAVGPTGCRRSGAPDGSRSSATSSAADRRAGRPGAARVGRGRRRACPASGCSTGSTSGSKRRKHLADLRKTLVYERVTDDTQLRRR